MGIGGHMLGERKLRALRRLTGLDLDRAYIRGRYAGGRVIEDGKCIHYDIDPKTGGFTMLTDPIHWTSCPKEEK